MDKPPRQQRPVAVPGSRGSVRPLNKLAADRRYIKVDPSALEAAISLGRRASPMANPSSALARAFELSDAARLCPSDLRQAAITIGESTLDPIAGPTLLNVAHFIADIEKLDDTHMTFTMDSSNQQSTGEWTVNGITFVYTESHTHNHAGWTMSGHGLQYTVRFPKCYWYRTNDPKHFPLTPAQIKEEIRALILGNQQTVNVDGVKQVARVSS